MRDGWQQVKFKDVAIATKGKLPKAKNELGIGMPYLTANFLRKRIPDLWVQDLDGAVLAEDGDCLILWDGAGAGDLFSAVDGVVSSTMAVVKSQNRNILRQFLTLSISSKSSYIKDTCRGTTVPHVSPDAIAEMDLSLPPLPDQERIVDLVSSVDFYIEALRQQLERAKVSRNAVLDELLNAGGDDWYETNLVDLCKNGLFTDGDWVESKDQDPQGKFRLIQLADIGDGLFLNKSDRWMNEEQFKRLRCTELNVSDILVARMPEPIGRACLYPEGLPISATVVDVAIVRTGDEILQKFLVLLINSAEFRSAAFSLLTGTTRQRISKGNLGKINFAIPPSDKQHEIIQLISSFDHLTEGLRRTLEDAKSLRSGLLLDLLSGNHEIPASYDQLIGAA